MVVPIKEDETNDAVEDDKSSNEPTIKEYVRLMLWEEMS